MFSIIKNQSGSSKIKPEKLYNINEVNAYIQKIKNRLFSQSKEAVKDSGLVNKQKTINDKAIADLVKKSNRLLLSISSHAFPFDFFPSTLNIEEGRITVIKRHLFSSEIHSVDIKDISNIFMNRTIFFAQLVIISKTYEENEIKIKSLRPNEAIFARRIIEGLRVFVNKQIETSGYTKEELIAKLEELSTTEIVT